MLVILPLLVGFLGLLLTGVFKIKCTAFLLHLAWITGYILLIMYFLMTLFIFYVGVINQKSCTLLGKIKEDPASLAKIMPNETHQQLIDIVLNRPD